MVIYSGQKVSQKFAAEGKIAQIVQVVNKFQNYELLISTMIQKIYQRTQIPKTCLENVFNSGILSFISNFNLNAQQQFRIQLEQKMNFWVYSQNNGFLYMPIAFTTTVMDSNEILSPPTSDISIENLKYKKKFSIKLNISREDLVRAGYNHKRSSWTQAQDKKLLELVKLENHNWEQIGKKMQNRNSKMCYSRYRRLNYDTKKRWSTAEQKIILENIQIYGMDWKKIAQQLSGRTARQVEQHYEFCLKPNLNKSEWTLEEDLLLVKLLEEHGAQWKALEKAMGNRTENQIKNRYFGRLLKISQEKTQQRFYSNNFQKESA